MKKHITEVPPHSLDSLSSLMAVPTEPAAASPGDAAGATAATQDVVPADGSQSPAETATADTSALEPVRASSSEPAPARRKSFVGWQVLGLSLTTLGVGIVLAPNVSARAAEWLDRLGGLSVHAGTLIVGGLVLFTVNVLRQTLSDIRHSLEAVGHETGRLEQIAIDGHTLRASLDTVKHANTALTDDVNKLQVQVKRLTDIVSNPDYTVSIFRLAASVDQLGKNLHMHVKEQFEAVLKRSVTIAEQGEHAERLIASKVEQVNSLLKEQGRLQQAAVQDGFNLLLANSDQIHAGVDKELEAGARIEARIQNQQETIAGGFASQSERAALHAGQVVSGLNDLRGRIDRQIEAYSASLLSRLEAIDRRIDESNRDHASEVKELGEQVDARIAGWADDLKQKFRSISEVANSNRQEIANQLDALGLRADDHARNHQAALQQAGEGELETRRTIKRDLVTGVEQLEGQLDQLGKDYLAALRKSSQEMQQAAATAKRELSASLELIGLSLERQGRDHVATLQKTSHEAQQTSNTTRREIAAKLEQLASDLEHLASNLDRQSQEHVLALETSWKEAHAATIAAKQELSDDLELIGLQLEEKVDLRCNGLTGVIESVASEIRSCVTESLVRAAATDALAEEPPPAPITEILATIPAIPAYVDQPDFGAGLQPASDTPVSPQDYDPPAAPLAYDEWPLVPPTPPAPWPSPEALAPEPVQFDDANSTIPLPEADTGPTSETNS